MKKPEAYESFTEIKARLDEIVDAVSDDDMPLDDALALYEEAVKLGTRVSSLIEQQDAVVEEPAQEPEAGEEPAASEELASAED